MAFLEGLDPVTAVNLILSMTIVAVAVWGYTKLKNKTPLYIGAAYVLFSTSHFILLFKITWVPQTLLIAIRTCGYFLVIFGLYAILKLVIELRRAEEQTQKSQALFKTMFESSGDAIFTMSDEIIADCNRTAEVMFGRTRDKINGKSVLEFTPERQPDGELSAEKVKKLVAAALEGEPQFFEWTHLRADGTPFPVEITLNRVKCAKKFYLQASIRDISLRKLEEDELKSAYEQLAENEEELRQQFSLLAEKEDHLKREEEKFHTMADFTVDWEFWLAPDNSFVYMSPSCEEITGYSPAEFMQDPGLMPGIVLKEDQHISTHHKKTVHSTTDHGHVDFRIVRKDGGIRWISHSCRPVYGRDGTYLGRRATNSDITARKNAEDALNERIKELNCLYGISGLAEAKSITIPELLDRAVRLLPPAWKHCGITEARIVHDGQVYQTEHFRQTPWMQTREIYILGHPAGKVEVCYLEERPVEDEGPFLKEERQLLIAVAERLGHIIGRMRAEEELQAAYEEIKATEEELRHQYTALAEAEEMFRNPVEHSPVGVYLQQDGFIRYANPRFAGMLGYSREDVINKLFDDLVDPDNRSRVCTLIGTQGGDNSHSRCAEFTGKKKDGTQIELEIFEAPMEYKGRTAFYGTLVDITERKEAEAAVRESEEKLRLQNLDLEASNQEIRSISETLQQNYDDLAKSQQMIRESEEKYRSLVDNISVAVYRNNVETPSRWLWVNPAFCKILGYDSPEDALSHPVSDIYYAPEDRLPLLRALNTEGAVRDFEIILKKKNGTPIWVSLSAHVHKNPDGTIAWVDGIGEDITERKRAEMAIRESEERVRSILESAAEAIYGIDKDGNCTFYNPSCARLTGYIKPDELLGKNMHTLIHHSHPDGSAMPRDQCRVALAIHEGKSVHYDDEVFWRSDGTSFPVDLWAYPQMKNGVVTGMVVTFFDITERKKMEDAIRTNLGEKEMLLKEIHHRVKNNMQVISGLLLVQSQTLKDDSVKALFNEAMTRIKSIALVHEQLYRSDNLSQIEYGGYLRKMFGPLFESYKADARKIAMVIEADNVMVTIEKAVPCSLIVNEMMSNSLKYAFPGDRKGEIRIRFALDDTKENYVLDYSDNGIGLPEGFVVGKTNSLGTTLINGLTKQLKGTITLVPGGQGVHYVITFPSRELRGK